MDPQLPQQQSIRRLLPDPAAGLAVYRNGLLQKAGSDFTARGQTIQFVAAAVPQPGAACSPPTYRRLRHFRGVFFRPQVRCIGAGVAATSAALSCLATCSIPAGILSVGDRIDVRFDFDHHAQSWGALLPFSATLTGASNAYTSSLTVDFQASAAPGDTVALRNYFVVRIL